MDDKILKESKVGSKIKLHDGTMVTVGAVSSSVTPSLEVLKMLADKIPLMVNDDEIKLVTPGNLLISDFQLDPKDEKPKKDGLPNKKLCKQLKPIPINKDFKKPPLNPRKRGKW